MKDSNIISPSVQIGDNVKIGHFCVVGDNVYIGNNVTIGNGVVIHRDTRIGDNVVIQDNAVIGKEPVAAANSIRNSSTRYQQELQPATIGNCCIIGTSSILYRGCVLEDYCYIADHATVRENATIGQKTIVGWGVLVENNCIIGKRCKLEANAYITAYSLLEDDVFIAPGVVTTNDNFLGRTKDRIKYMKGITVKKGGRIGANSTLLPGKLVGPDALVAAGSVVTKDIKGEMVVKGNPARPYKRVPAPQLLENNLVNEEG